MRGRPVRLRSDFANPAWFHASRSNGQCDHGRHIKVPFELLTGGYIGIYNVTGGTGWTQLRLPTPRRQPPRIAPQHTPLKERAF